MKFEDLFHKTETDFLSKPPKLSSDDNESLCHCNCLNQTFNMFICKL